MFSIDDSTFPAPTPVHFGELTVGDVFRTSAGYFRKLNASSAYNFTDNTVDSIGNVDVQPVTAVLTITAP